MSKFKHNPLCQQAMDIDPDVTACICDWVDAAERDTEQRIIKLLEDDCRCSSVEECYCTIGWAIEVIKGENNGN